jgi:hypothetical protein
MTDIEGVPEFVREGALKVVGPLGWGMGSTELVEHRRLVVWP